MRFGEMDEAEALSRKPMSCKIERVFTIIGNKNCYCEDGFGNQFMNDSNPNPHAQFIAS